MEGGVEHKKSTKHNTSELNKRGTATGKLKLREVVCNLGGTNLPCSTNGVQVNGGV